MKLVVCVLFAGTAWAQSEYRPFEEIRQFLQLTDSQAQTILANNGEYNEFVSTKQERIWQLQSEIATETAKDTLDPMALGVRYAEIETSCRAMTNQAIAYQQKNTSVLTELQKAKLQVLQEAMKLAPVISDAQSGNLIGSFSYPPYWFTSSSDWGFYYGSGTPGGMMSGCYSPRPGAIRIGDFSSTSGGSMVPANRGTGTVAPSMNKWFNSTGLYLTSPKNQK